MMRVDVPYQEFLSIPRAVEQVGNPVWCRDAYGILWIRCGNCASKIFLKSHRVDFLGVINPGVMHDCGNLVIVGVSPDAQWSVDLQLLDYSPPVVERRY